MKTTRDAKSTRCAAFLRGINVGGHKPIKMDELKKAFESLGFGNVKTILASGNVVFDVRGSKGADAGRRIENKLKKVFGLEIGVVVRTMKELQRLEETGPFKGIEVTPQTRLFVTFLLEKPTSPLKTPYEPPGTHFKIMRITDTEVCSVLTVVPGIQTTVFMTVLEKEFGKKITTRNWNTVTRILKSAV